MQVQNQELALFPSNNVQGLINLYNSGRIYEAVKENNVEIREVSNSTRYLRGVDVDNDRKPFVITTAITELSTSYHIRDVAEWVIRNSFKYRADVGYAYCAYGGILSPEEIIAKAMIENPWDFGTQFNYLRKESEYFSSLEDWGIKNNYSIAILTACLAAYYNEKNKAAIDDLMISFSLLFPNTIRKGVSPDGEFSWVFNPTPYGCSVSLRLPSRATIDCMVVPKN